MTSDLATLLIEQQPINPLTTIYDVAKLFKSDIYKDSLSIPVVEDGVPVGIISRFQISDLYITPFGREIFGRKQVGDYMNSNPMVVSMNQTLEEAAQYISNNMPFPLTEDFIITDDGSYKGLGYVLHLLRAIELRVEKSTQDLNQAYKDLKSSQSQLIQSEKMASLGQMVAGVAHEINTPLGYVKNNVQMSQDIFGTVQELVSSYNTLLAQMTEPEPDEDLINELMQQIEELSEDFTDEEFHSLQELFNDTVFGIDQISEIVLNLKNFSRLDNSKVDDISLNTSIDSALLIGRNNLKHKAEIVKDYKQIPSFKGSASQINQVFLNLLNNAAQAIEHDNGKILIKTYHTDTHICASIQDNGKGIPDKLIKKIFDPFFTTKPVGKGTGLGLSITFKIIEDHKGKVEVASKPGVGTKFRVSIPLENIKNKSGEVS